MFSIRSLVVAFAAIAGTTSAFVPSSPNHFVARTPTHLQVAIDTSDIKNGLTVEIDGEPFKVLSFSIMKQARGAAKTTIKFKNLMRGNTIENTYRSGEKFQTAQIDKIGHIFSYADENNFSFMNAESFEETLVPISIVDESAKWISEGMELNLIFFNDKCIEVVVPLSNTYEITDTEPNVKGNTAQGYTKPATLDSGAIISVPGYLEAGDKIRVDTDRGAFLQRAD
mmetsp:Transcript_13949/g.38343  ORF Transcript_13949/g.38343 Transcript_13949/m.38343 type:complete len:226 (-) Transcript_13949:75-752(-)